MSPQRIQRVIVGGITNCRNRFFFEPTDFSSNLIESIISEYYYYYYYYSKLAYCEFSELYIS
jgi:hypothetical protein